MGRICEGSSSDGDCLLSDYKNIHFRGVDSSHKSIDVRLDLTKFEKDLQLDCSQYLIPLIQFV